MDWHFPSLVVEIRPAGQGYELRAWPDPSSHHRDDDPVLVLTLTSDGLEGLYREVRRARLDAAIQDYFDDSDS